MQPSARRRPTRPEVFIIESLRHGDNKEGKIIESVLRMGDKVPVYRFVKTMDDLEDVAAEFEASRYRYLHLSCHGDANTFEFRFGCLSFKDFARIFGAKLKSRRLFISACGCVNVELVKLLIPSTRCVSVVGPYGVIDFDAAAVIWASYYYLAFRNEQNLMKRPQVLKRLRRLTRLFRINLNYYSRRKTGGIKRTRLIGKAGISLSKV